MKQSVFVTFCLMITFAMAQILVASKYHFSGVHELKKQNNILSARAERASLEKMLADYRFNTFVQEVGVAAPKLAKKFKNKAVGHPLRSLASMTTKSVDPKMQEYFDKVDYKLGVSLYKSRDYKEATKKLSKFVREYSYSSDALNAYGILVESYYQMGKLEKAVNIVNIMVDQFPESEITGYSLLRLGNIYQQKDRSIEASQMYMTVLESFTSHKELRNYARRMISQL